MNRRIKRLITKLHISPPKGYADKRTALALSSKTFEWLEDIDTAAAKLSDLLWEENAIPPNRVIIVADALMAAHQQINPIKTWCQPSCSQVEFKLFHCYGRLTNFLEDAEHLADFIDAYLGPTLEELEDISRAHEFKENVDEGLDFELCLKVNCTRHSVRAISTEFERSKLLDWSEGVVIQHGPTQRLYMLNQVFSSLLKGVLGILDEISVFPDDLGELFDPETTTATNGKCAKRLETPFFVQKEVGKVVLHIVECFRNGITTPRILRFIDVFDLLKSCLWLVCRDVEGTNSQIINSEECKALFENLFALVRLGTSDKESLNDALMLFNLVAPYAASLHTILPELLLINVFIATFNRIKSVITTTLNLPKPMHSRDGVFPPIELFLGESELQGHLEFFVAWIHNVLAVIKWPEVICGGDVFTYLLVRGGPRYTSLLRLALSISFAGLFTESEENRAHEAVLLILPIAARHNLLRSRALYWLNKSLFCGILLQRDNLLDSVERSTDDVEMVVRMQDHKRSMFSLRHVASVFGALNRHVPEKEQTAALAQCLGVSMQSLESPGRDFNASPSFVDPCKYSGLDRLALLCLLQKPDADDVHRARGLLQYVNSCASNF